MFCLIHEKIREKKKWILNVQVFHYSVVFPLVELSFLLLLPVIICFMIMFGRQEILEKGKKKKLILNIPCFMIEQYLAQLIRLLTFFSFLLTPFSQQPNGGPLSVRNNKILINGKGRKRKKQQLDLAWFGILGKQDCDDNCWNQQQQE